MYFRIWKCLFFLYLSASSPPASISNLPEAGSKSRQCRLLSFARSVSFISSHLNEPSLLSCFMHIPPAKSSQKGHKKL